MESRRKKISTFRIVMFFALAISICGILLLGYRQHLEQQAFSDLETEQNETVTETHIIVITDEAEIEETAAESVEETVEETEAPQKELNLERFKDLIAKNQDFAGWINIPNTSIDYPVMMKSDDPDYYLDHDFYGQDSVSGTPYIGVGCTTDSDNIMLYAHNMKNGSMFSDLLNYDDETYYKMHSKISFDTIDRDGTYDIIAAFREKVHYTYETDVFRFYNYYGELTEEKFDEYLEKIKELTPYEIEATATYGQQLITLVTCAYHTSNGRFVVVAARRED